ncbi:hypothetical protein [Pseudomonas koreensis]|uniref:hypothetical protein n=1 Tax=Pseudomonas koreensis TaxID=198620 RepID=UPI003800A4B5
MDKGLPRFVECSGALRKQSGRQNPVGTAYRRIALHLKITRNDLNKPKVSPDYLAYSSTILDVEKTEIEPEVNALKTVRAKL